MSYETIQYEVDDGVARITLDRENEANAMNLQMARELMHSAIAIDEDPSVRAVLIDARGKMFCAGGDLGSFKESGASMPGLLKEMTTYLHAGISRLARGNAPVVASVGGTAAGAGFSLMCATDLAICGESAKFTMAYTRAGLTPDGSSTYFLPRIIGSRRTLELMLTNRVLSAAEALDWGLVNRVVPDAELAATSIELARMLASGATLALGTVKKLVLQSGSESLETQMELEARGIADASNTEDCKEGMSAFFEKRAPGFQGR